MGTVLKGGEQKNYFPVNLVQWPQREKGAEVVCTVSGEAKSENKQQHRGAQGEAWG